MRPALALAALCLLAACRSSQPGEPAGLAPLLERARAELDRGSALDALLTLDDALALAPSSLAGWTLRAEALLEASTSSRDANFLVDSLAAWRRALELGAGPEALFGASRAARGTLQGDVALDFARRGLAAKPAPTATELRIAAEATFDAYIARRQSEQPAPELAAESEALLLRFVDAAPRDPWGPVQLANLFQWEGRNEAAVEALASAVELDLRNEQLHSRFVALMRPLEGAESVASFYLSLCARHEDAPLAHWFAAQELFELAVPAQSDGARALARFRDAEAHYRRCRELEESYASACQGYEVMCRAGAGWSQFHAGELDASEASFRSMESLFPGGLEWRLEGRVRSGVDGLQLVADRWLRGGADSLGGFAILPASKAARIYAYLHEYRPSDVDFANNAGFFHREWGVGLVMESREHRSRAMDAKDAFAREVELSTAENKLTAAREVLATCRDAYLAAAALAPEDTRIVNDAALILVYHFPSRVDEAERLLLQAVASGARAKDSGELPAQALDMLIEAWGDAHQNLGVLELLHRRNPAKAREWFEKTVAIGPLPRVPREWCSEVALPACERVSSGLTLAPDQLDPRIALLE